MYRPCEKSSEKVFEAGCRLSQLLIPQKSLNTPKGSNVMDKQASGRENGFSERYRFYCISIYDSSTVIHRLSNPRYRLEDTRINDSRAIKACPPPTSLQRLHPPHHRSKPPPHSLTPSHRPKRLQHTFSKILLSYVVHLPTRLSPRVS